MIATRTLAAFVIAPLVFVWSVSAAAQEQSPGTVLIIHLGAEDFPTNPVMDAAIRAELTSHEDPPLDYFDEYLEADHFGNAAADALADYVRQKYRGRRIDLVIAITDTALDFAMDHRADLFPAAPIVFAGLTDPDDRLRGAAGGLTGVRLGSAYGETLKLALALHPTTERVFVVAGTSNAQSLAAVQDQLASFSAQIRLTYVNEPSVARMLAVVKRVPPRSLILYIWHAQLEPGNTMYPDAIAKLVTQAAPVPVYGTNDFYIGGGVVGGVMRSTQETGTRVGAMARQILRGTRAQDIPIEAMRVVPIVDWRQVVRWGIDRSRIPPDADIRFREPTAWERYREYIVGIVAVMTAQLLLIAGLLAERIRRRRAEQTIVTREATLRDSYERSRLLAGRLLNAQEETRSGIARDLHDDVCQKLVGVSMTVSGLKRSGTVDHPQALNALADLQQQALGLVEGVRRMSHDLHPAGLRLVGLAGALEGHCIEVEKRFDVQVAFTADGDVRDIRPDVALCVFRTAQEALRNGALHGDARRLAVKVARLRNSIELTITDDGRGFDVDAVRRGGFGLGLVSMEERAHLLGGEVSISSRPGEGTTIYLRVPDLDDCRLDESAKQKDASIAGEAGLSPPVQLGANVSF